MSSVIPINMARLSFQKVNSGISIGGTEYKDLIMIDGGNPGGLEGDDGLDYYEVTGITATSETKIIEKTFTLHNPFLAPLVLRGIPRAVAKVGIARTGSTSGNVYFTKAVITIIKNGQTVQSKTVTVNFATNSTNYQFCDAQGFFDDFGSGIEVKHDEKLQVKIELYGKIATTENGKMKLCVTRGGYDTFLEGDFGLLEGGDPF